VHKQKSKDAEKKWGAKMDHDVQVDQQEQNEKAS